MRLTIHPRACAAQIHPALLLQSQQERCLAAKSVPCTPWLACATCCPRQCSQPLAAAAQAAEETAEAGSRQEPGVQATDSAAEAGSSQKAAAARRLQQPRSVQSVTSPAPSRSAEPLTLPYSTRLMHQAAATR